MFRDPSYFRAIREQVVPLLRTYPSLKIWVAGCSAGEEAYSLAILLREEGLLRAIFDLRHGHQSAHAAREPRRASIRSTASRASRSIIDDSGRQVLALRLLHRRLRHGQFSTRRLREHIVFSDHSLATDSVFAEVQFVSCRNVLIYFERPLQDRAVALFRDSLCRQGFLGLGSKESLRFSGESAAFVSFVRQEKIYQKSGADVTLGRIDAADIRRGCHRRLGRRRAGAVRVAAGAAPAIAGGGVRGTCICRATGRACS